METSPGLSGAGVFLTPHSLGNSINWKPEFMLNTEPEHLSSTPHSLGNSINWKLATSGHSEAQPPLGSKAPHSLGNSINWKLDDTNFLPVVLSDSPLAGELNKLETSVLTPGGQIRLSSPLAGELNKLETPRSHCRKQRKPRLPTRWGTQ